MREKMNDGWKKAGWIGLGAILGLLLSLNFSALAERDARLPIPYEDLQLFSAVFGRIKSDYVEPVSDDKLIREAINGMVHGLDPHSDFLDADAFKELQISTQGKFGGLGIEVGVEDGIIKVISPIEDTPAFRAGVKAGDLIIKIDDTVTRGLPLNKAVEKMRGKPGTQIVLTIARKDVDAPLTFNLTREIISFRSVRSKLVEPGFGYLRVVQFQEHTGEDVASLPVWCSTCAAIRVACSMFQWGWLLLSCRRTRWWCTPMAAHPTRGCASRRPRATTCVDAAMTI
jgi:carboxyl-terminal processing protease